MATCGHLDLWDLYLLEALWQRLGWWLDRCGSSPSWWWSISVRSHGITQRPEMALRLSKALGRSPESWLSMQDNHDLQQAHKSVDSDAVERIDFRAA
jgi:hypothetical protein